MVVDTNFQTPISVAKYMVGLVKGKDVLEPTPGIGNIVRAISDMGFIAHYPMNDFWEMKHDIFYDAVVMNPPFTPPAVSYKFLYKCMELSNHVVALMPWLTIINGDKRTCDLMSYGLKSITHLPRYTFKGSRIQCCIFDLVKGWIGKTEFLYFRDVK